MINNKISERYDYQQYILDYLERNNKYLRRDSKTDYNSYYAMDIDLLFKFLEKTQSKDLDKLKKLYGNDYKETIVNHINNEITKINSATNTPKRGLLDVLKNGVEFDNGVELTLMYKKPATSFNNKSIENYSNNIVSVMEEVYHKDDERIDLVIFLNGFAIVSIELKCNPAGQSVKDAIRQYREERDPKTRTYMFKSGVLVCFAMDCNDVYMTTRLEKQQTYFLPFNKGTEDGGKGNPHNENGYNVSYMWEEVLTKDNLINFISNYIYVEQKEIINEETGKKKYKERIIFPRYHQYNCLRKLREDILVNKSGLNYLIQHSAGSGKTNTIAWLSYMLSSLHDNDDKIIYDNIIIITDRVVVDRQLQDAVEAMDHQEGLIKTLNDDSDSSDLAEALNSNTKIIVSTIHKFSYIENAVKNMKDKTFAVIIDEAHSSTSGRLMNGVNRVLGSDEEDDPEDLQDKIVKEIEKLHKQKNVSMFAFTATPKAQTLQLFAKMNKNGNKEAFDVYSMRQAIEEGFILDVLENYTTYKTYYEINKKIIDDPLVKKTNAKKEIMQYINLHPTNISQKVEIILEHFQNNVMNQLSGRAKAMVITSSREGAVKFKAALDEAIKRHGYSNIKSLIAFSGKVRIGNNDFGLKKGDEYTEVSINKITEEKLRYEFDKDEYQILLVANKYQTGFDQPKLVAMYIDKKLSGISAVQTLSRLNRTFPGKESTFILDFVNTYVDIEKAFMPFYKTTQLGHMASIDDIYELSQAINRYDILDLVDVNHFCELLHQQNISSQEKAKMQSLLDKAKKKVERYEIKTQKEIRITIRSFIKAYSFMIQATCLSDVELHKKYEFLEVLIKELTDGIEPGGTTIKDKIEAVRIENKFVNTQVKSTLSKTSDDGVINPKSPKIRTVEEEELEKLSELIEQINTQTGNHFDVDVSTKTVLQVRDILVKNEDLKNSAKVNTIDKFAFTLEDELKEALNQGMDENRKLYTLLLNNESIKKQLLKALIHDIYETLNKD